MTGPIDDIADWDDDFDEDDDGRDDAMSLRGRVADTEDDAIVYVRKVAARDLPKRVTDQIEAAQDAAVDPDETFYAVCDEGKAIGLFDSRDLAFWEARENDLTPVSVH